MINLIWAMDENWLIGNDNKVPWRIKEDLLYYKSKTEGKNVLMGYNTYISLKGYYKDKPLPYGKIYVATRHERVLDDAIVINDIDSFLNTFNDELWVVGGASIYERALPYANYLYISFVKGSHVGDAYFPKFDLNDYKLISKKDSIEVSYQVFKRGD